MTTVQHLLDHKGKDLWHTTPDQLVFNALVLMADKNVGALPVIERGVVVGIFSERDYARKVILKGKHSHDIPIRDIMTDHPITVSPGQTVDECMVLMTERRVRHLPVVDGNRPVGMISIGDVVRHIMEEQRSTISHLEEYITGRR